MSTTPLAEYGNLEITAKDNGSTRLDLSFLGSPFGDWLKDNGGKNRLNVLCESRRVAKKRKLTTEHKTFHFPLRVVLNNLEDMANDRKKKVKRHETDPQAWKDIRSSQESDRLTSLANTEGWCE